MARILVDARAIADPLGGGVSRMARTWITHIATSRPDDTFVCVTTGWRPSETVRRFCDDHGMAYVHLRVPNKIWTIGSILGLTSLTSLLPSFDLVLLPNLGFTGRLTVPYDLLVHDLSFLIEPRWFPWKRRIWHRLVPIRRLIRHAQCLHCVSNVTRQDVIRLFNIEQKKTCLFSADPTFPSGPAERPPWLPDVRYALILGATDPRKNAETAVAAVQTFNATHPDRMIVPVILGSRSGSPGIPSGPANDRELRFLYAHAAVFLYSSWYEGFGLPPHEAHAFGTPVIASTAGALPDTAPPGTTFCHPAKIAEWVFALEILFA